MKNTKKTVTIRMSIELFKELKKMAEADGRTTSGLIEMLILKGLGARK